MECVRRSWCRPSLLSPLSPFPLSSNVLPSPFLLPPTFMQCLMLPRYAHSQIMKNQYTCSISFSPSFPLAPSTPLPLSPFPSTSHSLHLFQVADTVLLVHHAGTGVDSLGQVCLDGCCSQGLPTTLHVIHVSVDSSYDLYRVLCQISCEHAFQYSWNLLTEPLKYACDMRHPNMSCPIVEVYFLQCTHDQIWAI